MSRADQSPPRIVVLADYFLPGEKAGGPIRTLAGLFRQLSGVAEFRVVTRDRDLGDDEPYPVVGGDGWLEQAGVPCRYVPPRRQNLIGIARTLRPIPCDVLYINTLLSLPFSATPLVLRRLGVLRGRVVLAPRGQLSPGALALKRSKKRAFLAAGRALRLYHGVTWQATNDQEAEHIRRWFGARADIRVAPNLRVPAVATQHRRSYDGGPLRVVFMSRISPMKNLTGALRILAGVRAQVRFNIFGPREDAAHWRECEALIDELPGNVQVTYGGVVPADNVHSVLCQQDVLLLPTLGENYGHIIAEALAAGCAALVSDRTPWRGLAEVGVGWDLALNDVDGFRAVLEQCASEPPEVAEERARRATEWMGYIDADTDAVIRNADLLGIDWSRLTPPSHTQSQWTTPARR